MTAGEIGLERLLEQTDEAMVRPPRGRPRPAPGNEIVTLYHYSPSVLRHSVQPRSYWTTFGGRNLQDVARITGRDPAVLRFRYALRLTRADRDRVFRNLATVIRPGLPAADEYRNLIEIPVSWFERVTPLS
jgi:hypothetical protein